MTLRGACLCGNVRYEIAGKPRFMYRCHCGKCRAGTGASFATNVIVDTDKLTVTAGKESLARWESSPGKFRYFCSGCGSPIYSHGEQTKHIVSVRSGTLTDDPGLKPAYHAFAASKAPWVKLDDSLPCFDEWPDPALAKQLFGAP
jgi:hypothetical protein